ncbi:hypothetical protein GALMADRAFT_1138264 [Galerina marginata CBS 339.88]|uniref:Uncharacterized protein n=1 Tax=Galerina marginata (strain CBS 339.88) TaxID=685588 RepID=A0A067S7X4_GALM3|nr:hypothetical protein GALMADRAFT_1138264 [Galerina marginata CBS 339.88]
MLMLTSPSHHHHFLSTSLTQGHNSARRVPLASRMWAGAFGVPHRLPATPHPTHSRRYSTSRRAQRRCPPQCTSFSPTGPRVHAHAPGTGTTPLPLSTVQIDRRRILEPGNSASRLHHPLPLPKPTVTRMENCRHRLPPSISARIPCRSPLQWRNQGQRDTGYDDIRNEGDQGNEEGGANKVAVGERVDVGIGGVGGG